MNEENERKSFSFIMPLSLHIRDCLPDQLRDRGEIVTAKKDDFALFKDLIVSFHLCLYFSKLERVLF